MTTVLYLYCVDVHVQTPQRRSVSFVSAVCQRRSYSGICIHTRLHFKRMQPALLVSACSQQFFGCCACLLRLVDVT